jgi:hypothetical protein
VKVRSRKEQQVVRGVGAAALPRPITGSPALAARYKAATHRITAGERGGASVRSADESPILLV